MFPQSALKRSVLYPVLDKLCETRKTQLNGVEIFQEIFAPILNNIGLSEKIKEMLWLVFLMSILV